MQWIMSIELFYMAYDITGHFLLSTILSIGVIQLLVYFKIIKAIPQK